MRLPIVKLNYSQTKQMTGNPTMKEGISLDINV